MHVRLRQPLLLPLALATLLLATAAPLLANDEADRQFTFAARLMQQGEHDLAEEAFEEFVRRFPDDRRVSDVRYYRALLARRAGDHRRAAEHLARIDELHQVPDASLHLLRGQLAIEAGDPEAAIDRLEDVDADELSDTESRAAYHYLLATAYRAADNLDAAAMHFDHASDAESAVRAMALLELGKTRMEINQPMAALEALRSAAEDRLPAPQAAEARILAAGVAYDQRHYELAIRYYEQVIREHQRTEQFRPAVIGLLRSLAAAGEDEALLERYERSSTHLASGDQPEAIYLLATAHVRLERYEQAIETLSDFRRRFGDEHELSANAAYLRAVALYRSDTAAFEQWLSELESAQPDVAGRSELRYLRAQVAVEDDRIADAVRHLTPLVDDADERYARRALRQRAALNAQLGRHADAAADYAAYARRYEGDAEALDAARRAVDLAYRAGLYEDVPQHAEAYLARAGEGDSHAAAVRLRTAAALMQLDRNDAALEELDRLLELSPPERIATMGHYYRGLLLAARAQDQLDEGDDPDADPTGPAVDALERALEGSLSDQQRAEATNLLARMHRMAGREGEALDLYDQLRRQRPVDEFDPVAALWIGRGLQRRGSHAAALPWLESVIERGEDRAVAEAIFLAGRAQHALGRYDEAVLSFRRLVALSRGYGDRGRLGLARALAAAGETDEALNEYEGLLHVESSEIAAAALVESAIEHVRLGDRFRRADDASSADAEYTEARRRLNRVVILFDLPELGALPNRARLHLGRVLARQERPEDARGRLNELAESATGPYRDLARAELAILDDRRDEAVALLRQVIDEHADDAEAAADARQRLDDLGEEP